MRKFDPDTITQYKISKKKRKGYRVEKRYVYNLRIPDYIYEHIRKEATDHQKSINTVVIEMLEAALSPE